jgi:hypothetical protein
MIYLDNSVALAHLLAEDRFPPDELEFTPALAGRNQSERIRLSNISNDDKINLMKDELELELLLSLV